MFRFVSPRGVVKSAYHATAFEALGTSRSADRKVVGSFTDDKPYHFDFAYMAIKVSGNQYLLIGYPNLKKGNGRLII